MDINKLNLPIWIIHPDFSTLEKVIDINALLRASKLSLDNGFIKDCFLSDGSLFYEVVQVQDLGNYNSKWKFEFFNPLRIVKLNLRIVTNKKTIDKLKAVLSDR